MRPYSTTRRPITSERIGRALDRVAEIVAQGDQGEALRPLYDYLDGAMQDLRTKDKRLAAVRERFTRSKG